MKNECVCIKKHNQHIPSTKISVSLLSYYTFLISLMFIKNVSLIIGIWTSFCPKYHLHRPGRFCFLTEPTGLGKSDLSNSRYIKKENAMAIQIAIIDCGGTAIAHLSVYLNTEVYQKAINERWGF